MRHRARASRWYARENSASAGRGSGRRFAVPQPANQKSFARMIGKLTGLVDSVSEDHCILDVNGVGYLVHCPSSTLSRLTVGAPAALMIETKVSEDAIRLYGFSGAEEREWFRLLQTVQNVGAKVALAGLSPASRLS